MRKGWWPGISRVLAGVCGENALRVRLSFWLLGVLRRAESALRRMTGGVSGFGVFRGRVKNPHFWQRRPEVGHPGHGIHISPVDEEILRSA